MLVDGSGDNGLAFIYDEASERDSLDGQLLPRYRHGVKALGQRQWKATLKVALRLHDEAPWNAKVTKEHVDELLGLLHKRGIKAAIVMQSPATPGVRQVHSAWNMLGHNGNPYKWAGTAEKRHGLYVCPTLHDFNYEYIYGYLIQRWIRQAFELAQGRIQPLPWPKALIDPNAQMLAQLDAFYTASEPLAIDIETNMAGTIITAIGVANASASVSCPWHGYAIANREGQRERGLVTYPLGSQIRDKMVAILESTRIPKILHNGTFDVIQLAKHGIDMAAFTYDTLLLHRVCYPQFRHGLQQACATEFCVEPWKTLYRPPACAKGKDPWLGDPIALRQYNSRDAAATFFLWQSLKTKVGI